MSSCVLILVYRAIAWLSLSCVLACCVLFTFGTLTRVAQSLRFDDLHRRERGSHKPLRGSRLRPQHAGVSGPILLHSAVVLGCQCSRPYGHAGVPLRLRQLTGDTMVSPFTKDQSKFLVLLVRLLRVHLANFTPFSEFQLEARVALALLCSFMQVDSRTMGRSNWITPGSVAPVLMDLENRCLKDPTKQRVGGLLLCPLFGARMFYMPTV